MYGKWQQPIKKLGRLTTAKKKTDYGMDDVENVTLNVIPFGSEFCEEIFTIFHIVWSGQMKTTVDENSNSPSVCPQTLAGFCRLWRALTTNINVLKF